MLPTYRIVAFDNCGWGLNTRVQDCSGLESPEAAEKWLLDQTKQTIEQLDLPDKFLLAGRSMGGYLAALYASQHPDRIKSLFCISPAGMEPYE